MTGGLFILRSGEVTLNSLVYVTDDLGVYVTDDLGGKTHPGVNAGQPLIQIRPQFTLYTCGTSSKEGSTYSHRDIDKVQRQKYSSFYLIFKC